MIERLAYTQRLNYIPIYTSAQKTLPETNHIIIIMPMAKDTKKKFFYKPSYIWFKVNYI